MSADVLHVDFSGPRPTDAEATAVLAGARRAAAWLSSYTGLTARVCPVSAGRAVSARVESDGGFCLAVTVGSYSTLSGPCPDDVSIAAWKARRDEAPREVGVDVSADVEWLRDPTQATEGHFGHEYAIFVCATVDDAGEWVRAHCLPAPVPRATAAEVAEWERRIVVLSDPKDPSTVRPVKLTEAIRRFGPHYGKDISVDALVRDYAMNVTDARSVVQAVKKVVPRRRRE